MKNRLHLKIIFLALLLSTAMPKAETPQGAVPGSPENPFGDGTLPPPGAEYQEDDDFLDSRNNNWGFNRNNVPPPPPSNPSNQPTPQMGAPTPPTPPSRTTVAPTTPAAPLFTKPNTTQKSGAAKKAPVLTDYLELDPAVKGLEVKNFDLPDKDIKDIVTIISKWTGKNFILDTGLRGKKITIMGPSQVTLQEAYQAFLSALDVSGLTTIQSGKFIRIIDAGEARRSPLKTYAGDYAPKDDQYITRIFQLKFINADEVQKEFRDLVTRNGKLFAYEPTNSLIITDTGSNIQRIREILDVLDIKSYETTLHVLRIKNSSSKVIADMLGEIYSEDKGRPGQPRSFRKSSLERTRGGGVITKIIPDEQTNSLVVLANQAGFVQLIQLVNKLDVKVANNGKIHVYYCEYAKAEDLASTLSSLAGGSGGKSSAKKSSASNTGGAANPVATSSGPVTAELDGGVKITSDSATNSLVITAAAAEYQTIKKIIKKLDIPRLQVFVETAILEVALDDKTSVGVNIAAGAPGRGFAGGFIGDATALTTAVTNGIPSEGAAIPIFVGPSFAATAKTAAGTSVDYNVNTFMGLLNLITKNTKTSILSTPQIIALDNEEAEFKVQDETPVQTSLTVGTASSPSTGSIERLKTGIAIKLTPHINAASNNIRLELKQKVDSTKGSAGVPKNLADVQVATTSRETNTTVVVKDNDYVMLGGLMTDQIDEIVVKVPLLGDIPILGWLFKSRTNSVKKVNLMVLMHPKIINTALDSAALIKSKLEKRKDFVEKNGGGEDPHPEAVDELSKEMDEQMKRGENEPLFDYRNNNEEDGLEEKPKTARRTRIKSDPKTSSTSQEAEKKGSEDTSTLQNLESGDAQDPLPDAPVLAPPPGGEL